MSEALRKNEKCFIGNPSCGYGYESAKSCFVACPADKRYTTQIDLIKKIVTTKQYECYIALRDSNPGNFAFCTKICSKIIQSQFCIVLLNPSEMAVGKKKVEFPNPNVHFEYGMMISQNKYIIPLQDERYPLSFNIFPLDTIKYNEGNFTSRVSESIDNAIKMVAKKETSGQVSPGPEIFTFYNLTGFRITDIKERFFELLYEHGKTLNFYLFNNKGKYKFVGPFDNENPKIAILHTKLLIDNLISTYKGLVESRPEDAKKGSYDYLVKDISIDLIVPPFFAKSDISEKIQTIIDKTMKYPITIYYRSDYKSAVENEYSRIGEIKVLSE